MLKKINKKSKIAINLFVLFEQQSKNILILMYNKEEQKNIYI